MLPRLLGQAGGFLFRRPTKKREVVLEFGAADVAAVVAAGLLALAVVALLVAVRALVRTLRALDATLIELRTSTVPLVEDAHGA
ncbi:MAG: hypothetical protein C4320_02540, partial [Armatimonadota bacterium]